MYESINDKFYKIQLIKTRETFIKLYVPNDNITQWILRLKKKRVTINKDCC